jgi:FkbM family methyltransferase
MAWFGLACIEWHTLLPRWLGPDAVVLDLGANRGRFTAGMHRRFGCRCIGVEAAGDLFAGLQAGERTEFHHFAVMGTAGTTTIYRGANDMAASALGGQPAACEAAAGELVPARRLDEFVAALALPRLDLIKMDIEGAEIAVFDSLSDDFLRRIPQWTVEFHDFCGLVPAAEVLRILARMRRLGFVVFKMSRIGHQDTLLVQRDLIPLPAWWIFLVQHVLRHLLGAMRVLLRSLRIPPERYPYYS